MSTATAPAPRGLARATQEAAANKTWQAEVAARNALETAQANHSAQLHIDKLARKDPVIADFVEEYKAFKLTSANLRRQLLELEQKHAELAHEAAATVAEKIALKQQLDGAIANVAREVSRAQKAEGDVARLGQDLDTARSEAAKARAELVRTKDRKV